MAKGFYGNGEIAVDDVNNKGLYGSDEIIKETTSFLVAQAEAAAEQAQASEVAAGIAEDGAEISAAAALVSEQASDASAVAAALSETNAATSAADSANSAAAALVSEQASDANALASATSASNAATSESNAATSASNASSSAAAALASKNAAAISETNADASEAGALASKNAAALSETNAAASQADALVSKNAAALSETNAGVSETNAANSASAASTSASNAATSETNASNSAAAALASETAAGISETNAGISASAASTSASNAATSESNAATSASNASTSASNAATSETNAGNSASAASTSATNAANAEAAATANVTYSEEWANKAEDSLVSVAAGGNGVDEYSALHWAKKTEGLSIPGAVTFENLNANGDIGNGPTQVPQGNHNHSGVYEPVFSKNTGFNLTLGTSAGQVAEGNHTHNYLSNQLKTTLTDNDGYGNSNLTFNHKSGVPSITGNSGRIEMNTDTSGGAEIILGVKSSVTAGVAADTTDRLKVNDSGINVIGDILDDGANINTLYLGIGAKAADSQLLDGVNGASYARSDAADTISGERTHSSHITLQDNKYLYFGTGKDAEFWCNGSHMYTDLNSGIGNWYIRDGSTTRFTFDDAGIFTATSQIIEGSSRVYSPNNPPPSGSIDNGLSTAESGYVKWSNGLIFQWGRRTGISRGSNQLFTLPTSFASAHRGGVCIVDAYTSGSGVIAPSWDNYSSTQGRIYMNGNTSGSFNCWYFCWGV